MQSSWLFWRLHFRLVENMLFITLANAIPYSLRCRCASEHINGELFSKIAMGKTLRVETIVPLILTIQLSSGGINHQQKFN
jgi:hypothetical protein